VPGVTGSSRHLLRVAGGTLALAMLAGCGAGSPSNPGVTARSPASAEGSPPGDPDGRRACVVLGDVVAGQRADDLTALDEVAAAAAQSTDAGVRTAGGVLAERVRLVRGSAGQPDEARHRESLRQAVEDMRRACAEIGLD
jgi:hypothetical protein